MRRVIAILIFAFSEISCQLNSNCLLPSGGLGWCTPLQECDHFVDLLKNLQKPLPKDVGLVLREAFFCENKGGAIFVCCSGDNKGTEKNLVGQQRNSCELQGGLASECTPYDKCSPFIQLMANLRKPLPRSTPTLIRSSFLCGQDSERQVPKICCPAAALTSRLDETTTKAPETTTESNEPIDRFADHVARSALSDSKTCGIPTVNTRIVGGQSAVIGQYNWLANLGYVQDGGSETLFKCGGSLIGKRYVITAAHCVIQLPRGFSLGTVRLGEYDLDKEEDCKDNFCSSPPQDFKVEAVIPHPDYGSAFENDIAIVKLADEATINDFVSPICLPYTHGDDDYRSKSSKLKDGTEFPHRIEVAGWGATTKFGREPASVLQWLAVNVTDFQACKEAYAQRGGVLNPNQICAGGEAGKDSCVGDSGSALMRDEVGSIVPQFSLIGIVSFGPRLCGTEGIPGVYTRVNSYIPWILNTVQKLEQNN